MEPTGPGEEHEGYKRRGMARGSCQANLGSPSRLAADMPLHDLRILPLSQEGQGEASGGSTCNQDD